MNARMVKQCRLMVLVEALTIGPISLFACHGIRLHRDVPGKLVPLNLTSQDKFSEWKKALTEAIEEAGRQTKIPK